MNSLPDYTKLRALAVEDVIVLDCEYISRRGQPVEPICLCGISLFSGQVWRELYCPGAPCPLPSGPKVMYAGFAIHAECSYFLAAGWKLPTLICDLFAERMLRTNGRKDDRGGRLSATLLGTLQAYGIDSMTANEKTTMRDLILRGLPYTESEKESILNYCMEDVTSTQTLFNAMLPEIDFGFASVRGSYTRAVAVSEHSGIPMDTEAVDALKRDWPGTMLKLASDLETEHAYGVYVFEKGKVRWSTEGFENLVRRTGLAKLWPKTATGRFVTSDAEGKGGEVFRHMTALCPELEDLRILKNTFGELKNFDLPIGADGRCRVYPNPWWSLTGRNQPRKGFIFSYPKWTRFLIKPGQDRAVAYVDLSSAEFGIGAALSGDRAMMDVYESGEDIYLGLAKLTGACPPDATKATHGHVRKLYKITQLSLQYGANEYGIARQLGVSLFEAREIVSNIHRVYHHYFAWSEGMRILAQSQHVLTSPMGWSLPVGEETKENTIVNFPMQSGCADILRIAAFLAVDSGVQLCATVHDALFVEDSCQKIDQTVETVQACWKEASEIVLGGFPLRADSTVTRYPDRFFDPDGEPMWDRLQRMIGAQVS
jgi:DNA polymerase-1